MTDGTTQQFVLLPRRGVGAETGSARDVLLGLNNGLGLPTGLADGAPAAVTVLDSVQETGAKLVAADQRTADALNGPGSPVRALPLVEYPRPDPRPEVDPSRRLRQAKCTCW